MADAKSQRLLRKMNILLIGCTPYSRGPIIKNFPIRPKSPICEKKYRILLKIISTKNQFFIYLRLFQGKGIQFYQISVRDGHLSGTAVAAAPLIFLQRVHQIGELSLDTDFLYIYFLREREGER